MAVTNAELAVHLLRLEERLLQIAAELAGLLEDIEHGRADVTAETIREELDFDLRRLRIVKRSATSSGSRPTSSGSR